MRRPIPKNALLLLNFLIFFVISGCTPFELDITFDTVKGLKKSAPVIFEEQTIGSVDRIEYSEDGKFLVSVTIEKEFRNAVRTDSVFYIASDPSDAEAKALFMAHESETGSPLESGKTVKGQPYAPSSAMGIFKEMVDDMDRGLDRFVRDMKQLPESEQYKRFEKELEALSEKMKTAGEKTRDKIRDEIIPKLQKKLEELKKKGEKEKIKPIEKKLENLQKV
ncbi:MAG: MCE family protein [Desulfarculaceae bacterium]|nr:MCE family protein [Desulfarculaceae bacterium]